MYSFSTKAVDVRDKSLCLRVTVSTTAE